MDARQPIGTTTTMSSLINATFSVPTVLRSFTADNPYGTVGGLLGALPSWALAAFAMVWVAVRSSLWRVLMCPRSYAARIDKRSFQRLVAELRKDASERRAIAWGTEQIRDGTRVPKLCASWRRSYVAWTHVRTVGLDAEYSETVVVLRPLWFGPLLADEERVQHARASCTIRVLTCPSNDSRYGLLREVAQAMVNPNVPDCIRVAATAVVDSMKSAFDDGARILALHGPPGTGKSTAARILAHRLDAVLYKSYDPTRVGECLARVVADNSGPDSPLVVVMEEFDIALAKIVRADIRAAAKQAVRLDATDKATWNSLLDDFKYYDNVVLVLTTNQTRELLRELCGDDPSYLRPGRVDAWFEMQPIAAMEADADRLQSRPCEIAACSRADAKDEAHCRHHGAARSSTTRRKGPAASDRPSWR